MTNTMSLGLGPAPGLAPLRAKWGWIVALGVVYVVAGVIALGSVSVMATVATVIVVGIMMIVAGDSHPRNGRSPRLTAPRSLQSITLNSPETARPSPAPVADGSVAVPYPLSRRGAGRFRPRAESPRLQYERGDALDLAVR